MHVRTYGMAGPSPSIEYNADIQKEKGNEPMSIVILGVDLGKNSQHSWRRCGRCSGRSSNNAPADAHRPCYEASGLCGRNVSMLRRASSGVPVCDARSSNPVNFTGIFDHISRRRRTMTAMPRGSPRPPHDDNALRRTLEPGTVRHPDAASSAFAPRVRSFRKEK